MSSPKISIVIPVYNTEKFIDTCLESCITQTMKDIEIIIVNDCTPDNAMSIAENFAKNDSRIKIINQEKNTRQGGARNNGVKHASGEYIWFVDSDDFVDVNACQILYDLVKKDDLEILQFTSCDFCEKNGQRTFAINMLNNPWTKNKVLNPSNKKSGLGGAPNVTPWSYLVKTSLVKNIKFRESVYHEDVDFTLRLFSQCSRFETVSYTGYYYRTNPDSTTNTTLSTKRMHDLITLCYVLKDYVEQNKYKKGYFVYDSLADFVRGVKKEMESFKDKDSIQDEIKIFFKDFKKF